MIAKISRTVFKRNVTLTWYNKETKSVTETEEKIYEDITEKEYMNRKKRVGGTIHPELGTLISVIISTNTEELLASMTLDDFCKQAELKPVTKKENTTK